MLWKMTMRGEVVALGVRVIEVRNRYIRAW